jgi:hypothetical protein
MMDKKTVLMVGMFGGVLILVLPMLVDSLKKIGGVFKVVGIAMMVIAMLYFIAGDVIFKKKDPVAEISTKFNKEIELKLKNGEISQQKAFEMQKEMLEKQIQMQREILEFERKKQELARLKAESKPSMKLGEIAGTPENKDYKFPDVFGNVSDFLKPSESRPMEVGKTSIGEIPAGKQVVRDVPQKEMFGHLAGYATEYKDDPIRQEPLKKHLLPKKNDAPKFDELNRLFK